MKVYFDPIGGLDDDKIEYSFDGDIVTATYKGITDVFDFSGMPIGVMDGVETTLSVNPFVSAERKSDGLYIKVINFVKSDAPYEERYPEWTEA